MSVLKTFIPIQLNEIGTMRYSNEVFSKTLLIFIIDSRVIGIQIGIV